ncbi:MAG: hypothetical protein ABI592_16905 [Acidobacteriota bacterium]
MDERTEWRKRRASDAILLAARAAFLLAAALGGLSCVAHAPLRTIATAVSTSPARLLEKAGRLEAARHCIEVHPGFTLSVVEFDDQGRLWDPAQVEALDRTLVQEARESAGGLIVLVFAHGWKHDAGLCDQNLACVRTFLGQIAVDAAAVTRVSGGALPTKRVVGVYVGWRGRSSAVPVLREMTFWARKRVALRIGGGDLIQLLTRVDMRVKAMNADGKDRARLVIIGHSFGGTMVYRALANVLKSRMVEALLRSERDGPDSAEIEGFGDLVVLVNPAFEASLFASLHDLAVSIPAFSSRQAPVLVIIGSETDMPNRTWFPLGRMVETVFERTSGREERRAIRTAVGNYEPFFGYRLTSTMPAARSRHVLPDVLGEFRESCACSLPLEPAEEEELRRIAHVIGRFGREDDAEAPRACPGVTRYGRANLACGPGTSPANPFWLVRASDDVVHGHSGFFTNASTDFLRSVVMEAVARRSRPRVPAAR